MKGYKFYSKVDSTKEHRGVIKASDVEDAKTKFAILMNLPQEAFDEIFIVDEL